MAAFNSAMVNIILSVGLILFGFGFGLALDLDYDSCSAEEVMEENLGKLARANNDFALKLYRKLSSSSPGNVAFSPLSLSIAFAMLFYAARGTTADELRHALSYPKAGLPDEDVHIVFHWLLNLLMRSDESTGYVLQTANSILLDKHLHLIPEYKNDMENFYNASVRDVDFAKDSTKIVKDINKWVRLKTNGMVRNLLDSVSPASSMIILNALYFKGTWRVQFPIDKTDSDLFYNNGLQSEAKYVPMMHATSRFRYTETTYFQVLELPFKQRNVSMFIFLPINQHSLDSLEKNLSKALFFNIRRQMYVTKVEVTLPRFKVEYIKDFSDEMRKLGVKSIFQTETADFSGMTSNPGIHANQILHKVVLEVNEAGSQAAALTSIATYRMWPPKDSVQIFEVNHPFISILMENGRTCFFIARVNAL